MWASLLFAIILGLTSAEHGWKAGSQYTYQLRSKGLAALHQSADQYTGVQLKGSLVVRADSDSQLTLQVKELEYANVHHNLSGGWATEIPEHDLSYQKISQMKNKPFQLHFKNGVIKKIVLEKDLSQWEVNFYKSIASQLQVDTQGENLKKSRSNLLPKEENGMGVYKVTEDSVNGIYETTYEVSPMPSYLIPSRPELVPLPHLKGDGKIFDIVKNRNYSNSKQHLVYRFGSSGHEGWEAGTNQMGSFLSRSSQSRIIISGNLKRFTIQSSTTTEKVLVAPHLHNSQKGIVVSHMNLTLASVTTAQGPAESISNPREVDSLVYEYGPQARLGEMTKDSEEASSSSSSESDSSASTEKKIMQGIASTKKAKKGSLEQWMEMSSSSSSSESSSISSSEEYLARHPESINHAPVLEFQPGVFAWGSQKIDLTQEIKRIAREVGLWIQSPGNIPDEHTLANFKILSSLVGSASTQELNQATQALYSTQPSYEQVKENRGEFNKYYAWVAYRDAVAEAGTGPALVTIRQWVESEKVKGEEAAELLAALPYTARYPNKEYMDYFFDFIRTDKVQSQQHLNSSALFAFSSLVRKSQVDSEVAHNRYPLHLSGGKPDHRQAVEQQYIPYLEKKLQEAIQNDDSIKVQQYIRAIGNTAHPKIMAVFEPYLEGKQQISTFQRFSIVSALDEMTRTNPNLARNVLYRIYQNTAEAPEIRVAAVMQLMKTNPPAQMLQRMAEFTNYDHSHQVSAIVKSSIESAAANIDKKVNEQFSSNAKAAANYLTAKQYGVQYSYKDIRSYVVKEQGKLNYQSGIGYIQSQDGLLPTSSGFNIGRSMGGYHREILKGLAMISSPTDLLGLLNEQRENDYPQETSTKNSEYSYENIVRNINLKSDNAQQVEGSLLVNIFGANRFFSFDNLTVHQLANGVKKYNEKLQQGIDVQHTKFYNQYSMEVGFPLANGWPFVYSIEVPSLISFNGQLKGRVQWRKDALQKQNEAYSVPFRADISGEAKITYSSKTRGKMGFVAPFANQMYVAGVEKNFHVHVPLKGSIKYDPSSYNNSLETVIEPLTAKSGKQQMFQSSTDLYTTAHEINDVKPYLQGQNALPVYSKPLQQIYQYTLGREMSGYEFEVTVRGEENFLSKPNIWKAMRQHDPLSALLFSNTARKLQNDYISIKYNPQMSSPQPVNITLSFISNEGGPVSSSRFANPKSVHPLRRSQISSANLGSPESYQGRREELLENVQSGMQDAKAHVLDASIYFGGQQRKAGYSLTLAHANSPVSSLSRVLFYYKGQPFLPSENTKPYQASGEIEINDPRISPYNFREALNQESITTIEGKLTMQQESNPEAEISFQGKLERTNGRKDHVRQLPTAKLCEEQMKRGDYFQSACRNISLDANYMDKYNFVVKYKNVPKEVQRVIYSAYGMARSLLYPYNQEKFQSQGHSENQITVGVKFAKDLSAVNVSIATPSMDSEFENVRMPQMAIPMLVYHPKYNQFQLYSRKLFWSYTAGVAVLDGKSVTTFNNKSYPIDLGNCYHVFAVYAPHEEYGNQQQYRYRDAQRKFAILVKESNSQSREVLIIIGNDVVNMKPGVIVQANGQDIQFSEQKVSKWSSGQNSIEGYVQNGGVHVLLFPLQGIEVAYDGSRLQVTLPSFYMSRVRGLAGTYGGQETVDFSAPDNRVLKNPLLFAASYALTQDQACRGPAKERYEEAQKAPRHEKTVIPGDVVSDREAGREQLKTVSVRKNHMSKQMDAKTTLTELRTRYIEDGDRTCFSTRPQISCTSNARATRRMQKNVDFHCIQTSSASRHWVQMIKNGANPDFSQKGSNRQIPMALPQECQPKA